MNTFAFVKKETINGVETVKYITNGEWCLECASYFQGVSANQIVNVWRELTNTKLVDYSDRKGLPSNLHRISNICNAKTEAKFTVDLVEINMTDYSIEVLHTLKYEMSQTENDVSVKIEVVK